MVAASDTIQIVILAAGHGRRMNHELPKVLVPLNGKPLVMHLLESVAQSGVCARPILVVGKDAELIKSTLGSAYEYVTQTEQLGTGHAVASTRSAILGRAKNIMVLYGDHPYVSAPTIQNLAATHETSGATVTMATVIVPDFTDWRASFENFGRIVRDQAGKIGRIVEVRDASVEQQQIREVNPGYYCFKVEWLYQRLEQLTNINAQHEYYLTDVIAAACRENELIMTVSIDAREALGVNTPEQLNLAALV